MYLELFGEIGQASDQTTARIASQSPARERQERGAGA
jgi:hypothetical protein